jgi:hypothetical protein
MPRGVYLRGKSQLPNQRFDRLSASHKKLVLSLGYNLESWDNNVRESLRGIYLNGNDMLHVEGEWKARRVKPMTGDPARVSASG